MTTNVRLKKRIRVTVGSLGTLALGFLAKAVGAPEDVLVVAGLLLVPIGVAVYMVRVGAFVRAVDTDGGRRRERVWQVGTGSPSTDASQQTRELQRFARASRSTSDSASP